ncbi:MAG: S1 RNA-binding domain-containing protein [Terracidiphilus sp.]
MTNDNLENIPPPAAIPAETAPGPIPEPAAETIADAISASSPAPQAQSEAIAAAAHSTGGPEPVSEEPDEPQESFADLLSAFEQSHTHKSEPGKGAGRQLLGTVVSLSAEQVFLDIGYKTEGVLPRSAFENNAETVKPGDSFPVSVTGRNAEHYYELSRFNVAQPRDWSALEAAFADKTAVVGTVTEVRKGGLTVDIGVRAFLPASRSGTRDAAEMEKLVGTEITCRITKLDVTEEDVVVDRRVVLEEQARGALEARREAMKEGETVTGTVRSLVPYGAFVDLGGVDGLLHVSDFAYSRVAKPEDMLAVGQQIQVRILKIDPGSKKISLGLKQLQPEPWETVPGRFQAGQRVRGTVTRLTDFGAFVEIEPGVEGLIHISEMSWSKKVHHPSDLLKEGDRVDAVILAIKPEERRISLGLKQTLADPWTEVQRNFPVGSAITGPVTKLMGFGAFVQLAEGVEGLVHISEIVADRRLNHPSEVLHTGQIVQAQVVAIDAAKHQIRLSMKQLIPTGLDEYMAEHKAGDRVSGRVIELSPALVLVELGEGIRAVCRAAKAPAASSVLPQAEPTAASGGKLDLSSLSSQLKSRWKGNSPAPQATPEPLAEGQIRTFKIVKLDGEARKIEVELA